MSPVHCNGAGYTRIVLGCSGEYACMVGAVLALTVAVSKCLDWSGFDLITPMPPTSLARFCKRTYSTNFSLKIQRQVTQTKEAQRDSNLGRGLTHIPFRTKNQWRCQYRVTFGPANKVTVPETDTARPIIKSRFNFRHLDTRAK